MKNLRNKIEIWLGNNKRPFEIDIKIKLHSTKIILQRFGSDLQN